MQSRGSAFFRWEWFRRQQRLDRPAPRPIGWVEQAVQHLTWLRPDVRALAVKDLRTFWRDTTQWGQTIMLFGLLGAYVINLRHFTHQLNSPFWTHLIAFLNLSACSLNLATLTTRFVYPQFSLEGKRLWIVGMAPLGLARVVKTKFWLASSAALMVTLGLVGLSCHLLRMPAGQTLSFSGAITVMTLSLTGLAVGLGVLYPNFKEDNPSKIVSGFGGTLCLVLSFFYILGSVLLLALGTPFEGFPWQSSQLMISGWLGFVLLSFAVGWLPLRLALRRVTQFEL
jgi:ABC-2 type transport system permease protein